MSTSSVAAALLLGAVHLACAQPPADPGSATPPYDFAHPALRVTLPVDLTEVSALTLLGDDHLGALQDEDGELYILSRETGELLSKVDFGNPGDWEGLELVGRRLFAMQSDGDLFELTGWETDDVEAVKYDNDLGADKCNAEGLGATADHLLIACKNEDGDDRNRVYAFDLTYDALVEEPALALDPDDVGDGKGKLRPSALAVHPLTGHTVVLSSSREALVSIDADGAVAAVWDLRGAKLRQPEGLAFEADGDVWVASEGKKGRGELIRVTYDTARVSPQP